MLAHTKFFDFYITVGGVGILWFIPWLTFIHESPAVHPRILPEEKEYIETSIGSAQDKTAKVIYRLSVSFIMYLQTVFVLSFDVSSYILEKVAAI